MSYFVVGGTYKDTTFKVIEEGGKQKKIGPFKTYEEAKQHWDKISWENVDNCYTRFIILPHK